MSRVKIAEETVSLFFFSEFFRILSENFSDFRPKNFKKLSKLHSTCPEEQFVAWNFFLKFWIVLDFLQKPSAWFPKFYLRVQGKNCGTVSLFFFSEFFRILSEKFFGLSAKKFQKVVETTFYVSSGTVCGLKFFLKFWIVLDFLQKPSAWLPKFYLRVQGKNCGTISLFFFSEFFRIFWAKIFSDFRPKISRSFQNYLLRVQRNSLWLEILRHDSQNSIYVSRVQIAEEIVFLFFFSDFFRILSENFFRLSAKKFQKVVETTFYVSSGTVCGLKFFSKVLNRFGFSAETFGMVPKILSTCPG